MGDPRANLTYRAGVFAPSLGRGRAPGQLKLGEDGLWVDTGKETIRLPTRGLRLRRGGASDRILFFEHADFPSISLHTNDFSVLKDERLLRLPGIEAQLTGIRRQGRRKWYAGIAALLMVAAIPLALVLGWGQIVRTAAEQVPVSWEERLAALVLTEYSLGENLQAFDSLDAFVAPLVSVSDNDRGYAFDFYIADDDVVNAFAAPGGLIVINRGLVEQAQSSEELLGVVAHEIVHVTAQHGVRGIINSLGWLVAIQLLVGDASGLAGTLASAAPFVVNQQYSQAFEREADAKGVDLLQRANVNPVGLRRFFERLLAASNDASDPAALESALGFLSSHPATVDRIERLREIETQGDYVDLRVPFEALRSDIAAWGSTQEESIDFVKDYSKGQ